MKVTKEILELRKKLMQSNYSNRPPESDGTEEQTTCQHEEIIEDWPYCNHKETKYYDCKSCEFGGMK